MDILEMLSKIERLLKTRTPKMTKAEFYKACGITASAVSQWRNGKTQPARSTVDKMADVLGVTADYLTGEQKEKLTVENGELTKLQQDAIDLILKMDTDKLEKFVAFLKSE